MATYSFDKDRDSRVQSIRWKIARRHLNQRRTHRLRWMLLVITLLLLVTTGASAAATLYFVSQLPPTSHFHIRYAFQDARIYDVNGNLLYNMADLRKNRGRRVVEPLQARSDLGNACRGGANRIPLLLQNATIATEDATFYQNPGFDPGSIMRAAYDDIKYGYIVSGASTITQQVVRNTMLDPHDRSIKRKAQEVALAYEISKRYSKNKILWYYLNSVPYGNLAIGAQAAAEVYFHIPVCRLNLAQAALLAGLPRAPTSYNPVQHRVAAMARLREVLSLLRKHGYVYGSGPISAALIEANGWRFSPAAAPMLYPQFVRYAISQIDAMPKLHALLYHGIDIYTTLDPRLQNLAQTTVTHQIDALQAQHVTDGALVSLDLRPQRYGWILAMVGSAHYRGKAGQINMAVSPRQPGSSMKPFNYIWAFTHGQAGPATTVLDTPIRLPDPHDTQSGGWYQPRNYDKQFHGMVTLRQALANSLNVPAVKVEYYLTGPAHVAQTAAAFGMKSLYRDNPHLDCSVCYAVTLGGLASGTRLLEETSAYGVFATAGVTVPPVAIWKVVQRTTGQILYCSAECPSQVTPDQTLLQRRHRVVDPSHAFEMTDILSDNNARCTVQVCEFGLNSPLLLSHPAAAKTGTTTSFSDNWTVGYTPQIVTGVWAGNADRSPMVNVIGVTGAAPIWHDFMEGAFHILRLPSVPFVAPLQVGTTNQCTDPVTHTIRFGGSDLYVADGQPPPLCSIHEKGYLPVPCAQYPANPLPPAFRCPLSTPYFSYGRSSSVPFSTSIYPQITTIPQSAAPSPG